MSKMLLRSAFSTSVSPAKSKKVSTERPPVSSQAPKLRSSLDIVKILVVEVINNWWIKSENWEDFRNSCVAITSNAASDRR